MFSLLSTLILSGRNSDYNTGLVSASVDPVRRCPELERVNLARLDRCR